MKQHAGVRIAIAAGALTVACATQPATTINTGTTTTTSGGEVELVTPGEAATGLSADDAKKMLTANVVAHIVTADSLEIVLAKVGAERARDSTVRFFAQRMMLEHGDHMQTASQYGLQNGVLPIVLYDGDGATTAMTTKALTYLSSDSDSAAFDRRFMAVEVEMHEHMLHELATM